MISRSPYHKETPVKTRVVCYQYSNRKQMPKEGIFIIGNKANLNSFNEHACKKILVKCDVL